mmetsp:Transcript_17819/g.40368  ORF Transcript_17819/g.40368 Transcript_17819/m.40368 type:complete len:245 (-) Transcript_17819:2855-3589(-)
MMHMKQTEMNYVLHIPQTPKRSRWSRHRQVFVACSAAAVLLVAVAFFSRKPQNALLSAREKVEREKNLAHVGTGMLEMLAAVPVDLGCDEACKTIISRVQRAWEVGMMLFDACGSSPDKTCKSDSESMCACEKKAGRMMCSELEYAWEELCPNTKSIAMHQSVCNGGLITQMRSMCSKCELLPGVLVNHFPLGGGGLDKIDDSWVKFTGSSSPAPAPAAPAASQESGGGQVEGGGVASGMDASD